MLSQGGQEDERIISWEKAIQPLLLNIYIDWRRLKTYFQIFITYFTANIGQKINYQKTIIYYGKRITYNAIENQFHKFHKKAKKIINKINYYTRLSAPIHGSPIKKRNKNK